MSPMVSVQTAIQTTSHWSLSVIKGAVDSPICSLCNQVVETLSHVLELFKIQDNWFGIQGWLHGHCSKILLSRELIILGSKVNTVTDRIFDLFMLIAKYRIFTSRLQGTTPYLNVFIQKLKNRFSAKKYCYAVNLQTDKFRATQMLYFPYFSQGAAYITSQ